VGHPYALDWRLSEPPPPPRDGVPACDPDCELLPLLESSCAICLKSAELTKRGYESRCIRV
jgi:hypothetical protein